MRSLRSTVPALAVLAALALFTSVAADGLAIVPMTNGRFEAGKTAWTLGPGTAIADADYSGDSEAWINATATTPRLVTNALGALAPASLPVSFAVEDNTLHGVTLAMTLLDLRDPAGAAGTPRALAWSFESLGPGRYYLYPAQAEFPSNPAWAGMTEAERESEIGNYLYAGLSFSVEDAPFPALVDDFGFTLGT